MAKQSNKAPVKAYGIDDFIEEIKRPMAYIDIMARIHLLTGYNKSALILLRKTTHRIMDSDKARDIYNLWIKDRAEWSKSEVNRMNKMELPDFQYIFYLDALDALITGRDIQDFFLEDPIHFRLSAGHSNRVKALVIFYAKKPIPERGANKPLYDVYNQINEAKYRQGETVAKNKIKAYINDHETCGDILQREGNQKAISHWQEDRKLLKRRFIDYYPE